MRDLCADLGEREVFRGDPARQVTAGPFHHSGGRLTAVNDLASALAALEEIVEQGEGTARGEVWDGDQDIFHPDGTRSRITTGSRNSSCAGDTGAVTPRDPGPLARLSRLTSAAFTRCDPTRFWKITLQVVRSGPPRKTSTTPTALC
ncbi:hypothetical protein FRACA_470024 [Frankia canadensis]|uniref:Iminophenyl-pyruvate dimer synthase domain-containing protein n=1 Tax=Frankia canadensis TaxID=1836972 RepID=A0A2I2KXU0_9ACTN|nr:hypothetical protein FRACA_470024 [Frankia canadensis]SOU57766.1 hypothetical protein FRACA_470024 [Frankia canadensis]